MDQLMQRVRVWDWPVRVGHWLLVAAFVIAWITGESEEWRLVHIMAGGGLLGIVSFRLLWGLVGTQHARFAEFVRGPGAVAAYLRSVLARRPTHFTGHNPAGGWMIVLLLTLAALAGASGWLTYQEMAGEWMEEVHEVVTAGMLTLVLVHIAGVVVSSRLHGENLVRAMMTGVKFGAFNEAVAGRAWVVPVLLTWMGACAWWLSR